MPSRQRPHDLPGTPQPGAPARLPVLTRRTVVRAGAVVGLGAVLGTATGPAAAVAASAPGRLVVRRSSLGSGRTTGTLRAPHRFDLLGAPVRTVSGIGLEVRARARGGRWSGWRALSDHDGHAPDGRRAAMSEPLWFGDAEELELRSRRRPDRDLRLDLIAVPVREKRAAGRASTRAAADGGVLGAPAASTRARGAAATTRAAAPTIVPRAAWAAGLKPKGSPSMGSVQVAFVHHTVNGNAYAPEDSAAIVRAIFEYHVRSNGWNDIGYNFLVDRYGQIFEGRAGGVDQPVIGAQAVGWNSISTGIAIIGTFEGEPAPAAALAAVASIIRWKLPLHGAPTAGTVPLVSSGGSGNRYRSGVTVQMDRISGHRDGCSTDCPGGRLYGQLADIRTRVGDIDGAPAPALTITGPDGATPYGEDGRFTGRLTLAGAPMPNAPVVLEKRSPKGSWVPMTQTTTDGDGGWSADVRIRAASAVRARGGGATSSSVTPALDPDLTLRRPTKYPRTGSDLRVRGTARGVDEVTIVLRRKQGSGYITAARRKAKVVRGRFSGTVPVRKSALHLVEIEVKNGGTTFRSTKYGVRSKR